MDTEKKNDFGAFGLPSELLEGLTKLGFASPTRVQLEGIPAVMAGGDLLAIAPTGTGKTGAFCIPAIANLTTQTEKQVLILVPTRELAAQTFKFIASLLPHKTKGALLVGGESFGRQFRDWNYGVDYIVATPGRLMDHVTRGLDLRHIGMFILDEVDRMLDMGFAPQIEQIAKKISAEHQTLFFSATLPQEIVRLTEKYLKNPTRITVNAKKEDAPKIQEMQVRAAGYEKLEVLHKTILQHPGKILVFTRTQMFTERLAEQLESLGVPVARLHGGRTQAERTRSLEAFRMGKVRVMIATDVAARGIDVVDIEVVINFDKAATKEDHTHRIGRTGRNGREGLAITFVEGRSEKAGANRFQSRNRNDFQKRRSFGARPDRNPPDRNQMDRRQSEWRKPERRQSDQRHHDERPRHFSKAPFSKPPFEKTVKRQFASEGTSGAVRFFRNKETTGPRRRKHISQPFTPKPMPVKNGPAVKRGKMSTIRRSQGK